MKKSSNKRIIILSVLVALVVYVIAVFVSGFAQRAIVRSRMNSFMENIRQGTDNEVIDRIVGRFAGDSGITRWISGENVNDIYHVLMRNMEYSVTGVESKGDGVYRAGIRIRNDNHVEVAKEAWNLFKSRYEGNLLDKALQAADDARSDKSQLFASLFTQAAQNLAQTRGDSLSFSRDFVVLIHTDDVTTVEVENGELAFLLACAGIPSDVPVPAGGTVRSGGGFAWLILLIVVIVLTVLADVLIIRRKNKKGAVIVPAAEKTTDVRTSATKHAILRALSPQHGGMMVALHETPVMIGRDPNVCKVTFPAETSGVSARHSAVLYDAENSAFVLTDLGSTYGTYRADGRRLDANAPYRLFPGDVFYLGNRENAFRVELSTE